MNLPTLSRGESQNVRWGGILAGGALGHQAEAELGTRTRKGHYLVLKPGTNPTEVVEEHFF